MKSLVVVLALASPVAFAAGGTVVRLQGQAAVDRDGQRNQAAEASPLYTGDTLVVADQGIAQVRFEDDSVFVIPGEARFRIDEFRMAGPKSGGRAIYTLESGGLRTLTGKVSKAGKDVYELRTEEATITVAGSAYTALRCQGACASKYKAGLYVRGESGTIIVTSASGQVRVGRNQTVYVAAGAGPVLVRVSPLNDPELSGLFGIAAEFDAVVHPPRIEFEQPASPS